MTVDLLSILPDYTPNLKKLSFNQAFGVTNEAIAVLANSLMEAKSHALNIYSPTTETKLVWFSLQWLDLSNCLISDLALHLLLFSLPAPSLSTLILDYCKQLTDSALRSIKLSRQPIKTLSLHHVDKLTNTGVAYLANADFSDRMQYLDIVGCVGVTNIGLRMVLMHCTSLTYFAFGTEKDSSVIEVSQIAKQKNRSSVKFEESHKLQKRKIQHSITGCIWKSWQWNSAIEPLIEGKMQMQLPELWKDHTSAQYNQRSKLMLDSRSSFRTTEPRNVALHPLNAAIAQIENTSNTQHDHIQKVEKGRRSSPTPKSKSKSKSPNSPYRLSFSNKHTENPTFIMNLIPDRLNTARSLSLSSVSSHQDLSRPLSASSARSSSFSHISHSASSIPRPHRRPISTSSSLQLPTFSTENHSYFQLPEQEAAISQNKKEKKEENSSHSTKQTQAKTVSPELPHPPLPPGYKHPPLTSNTISKPSSPIPLQQMCTDKVDNSFHDIQYETLDTTLKQKDVHSSCSNAELHFPSFEPHSITDRPSSAERSQNQTLSSRKANDDQIVAFHTPSTTHERGAKRQEPSIYALLLRHQSPTCVDDLLDFPSVPPVACLDPPITLRPVLRSLLHCSMPGTGICDSDIPIILQCAPNIASLDLSFCLHITDITLELLLRTFECDSRTCVSEQESCLKTFPESNMWCWECSSPYDSKNSFLTTRLYHEIDRKRFSLNMSACTSITGKPIIDYCQKKSGLIKYNSTQTNNGKSIAHSLLCSITLSRCPKLSVYAIKTLCDSTVFPHLIHLDACGSCSRSSQNLEKQTNHISRRTFFHLKLLRTRLYEDDISRIFQAISPNLGFYK